MVLFDFEVLMNHPILGKALRPGKFVVKIHRDSGNSLQDTRFINFNN
jgi:hypothetical protein